MKNRDSGEDAILTETGKLAFQSFISKVKVPLLSKGTRDLIVSQGIVTSGQPVNWGELLLSADSLFVFFDALEQGTFLVDPNLQDFVSFVSTTDIPLLSKGVRDLVITQAIAAQNLPAYWAAFLQGVRSLFNFFDALETEYF